MSGEMECFGIIAISMMIVSVAPITVCVMMIIARIRSLEIVAMMTKKSIGEEEEVAVAITKGEALR